MSTSTCKFCGGCTKTYDRVKRILKGPRGAVTWVYIYRDKCEVCGRIGRVLTDEMLPYKHYSKDIIEGVVEGLITEQTYGFEDCPCEMTMLRWREKYRPLYEKHLIILRRNLL